MPRSFALVTLCLLMGQVACSTVLPVFGYPPHATRRAPPPDISERAQNKQAQVPALNLRTTSDVVDLSRQKKPLALFFFRGHWCPHCRRQLEDLNTQVQDLDQLRVRLIAISADDASAAQKLRQRLDLRFDLSGDPELEAIRAFGVLDEENEIAWPALFVIDQGAIVYRWIAKDLARRREAAELVQDIRSSIATR